MVDSMSKLSRIRLCACFVREDPGGRLGQLSPLSVHPLCVAHSVVTRLNWELCDSAVSGCARSAALWALCQLKGARPGTAANEQQQPLCPLQQTLPDWRLSPVGWEDV